MNKKKEILLGAHVSISKGFSKAIEEGEKIGASVIQIFTKSSRSWSAREISKEEIDKFKKKLKNSKIKQVIAHSSYLINLGSPKKETEEKSLKSINEEIERCEKLGISYLVIHPGAHLDSSEQESIKRIAKNLDFVLKNKTGKTKIILETTAGQGTTIGYKFDQIKKIINLCKENKKLGTCIDTCHIYSAGYDITTDKTYKETMNEFSKIIGFKMLNVIHLNNSKTKLGSKKDRHENIAKGSIPEKTFKLIMNDNRLKDIPKILETPAKDIDVYEKEIKLLKNMIN